MVTDWRAFTPTGTWTTNTTNTTNTTYVGFWRRVGDNVEYDMTAIVNGGAPGPGVLAFNTFPGHVIDSTKLTQISNFNGVVGLASLMDDDGVSFNRGSVVVDVNTLRPQAHIIDTTLIKSTAISSSAPYALTTGARVNIRVSVPIVGWSSNVQMSNDTDTRVVAARYEIPTGTSVSTSAPLNASTKIFDTHGAVTTGVNWRFTAPVSGIYSVDAGLFTGASALNFYVYKNGVQYSYITTSISYTGGAGSTLVDMRAGDYIEIRADGSGSTGIAVVLQYISIFRLSGPSVVAASEAVSARYVNNSGPGIPQSTPTFFGYPTRTFDTHNAYDPSPGIGYVVPVSGTYLVSADYANNSATAGTWNLELRLNGVVFKAISISRLSPVGSKIRPSATELVRANAGDRIQTYYSSDIAGSTMDATANVNTFNVVRVGN